MNAFRRETRKGAGDAWERPTRFDLARLLAELLRPGTRPRSEEVEVHDVSTY